MRGFATPAHATERALPLPPAPEYSPTVVGVLPTSACKIIPLPKVSKTIHQSPSNRACACRRALWIIAPHLDEHAQQTELLHEQAGQVDMVITHWLPTRDAGAPRFKGGGLGRRQDVIARRGALKLKTESEPVIQDLRGGAGT